MRKMPVMFFNASLKVRGSSRSIKRDAPNWSASVCRFASLRDPTEKCAPLLSKFFATSFPTCPVTPNTSRLLEPFICPPFQCCLCEMRLISALPCRCSADCAAGFQLVKFLLLFVVQEAVDPCLDVGIGHDKLCHRV